MSIYFIRHAKVNFYFEERYNSNEYLNAVNNYNNSEIEKIDDKIIDYINGKVGNNNKILTSTLKRTIDTADQLFPNQEKIYLKELDELLLYPYKKTYKKHNLWKWKMMGKIQWCLGLKNQLRSRKLIQNEISCIIKYFEKYDNLIIVGHILQFEIMIKKLKKMNYTFDLKSSVSKMHNLEIIECKRCPTTAST